MTQSIVDRKEFISNDHLNTLIQAGVVPKGTPKPQVEVFAQICAEKGISPFSKEIYLTSYRNNSTGETTYTPITGINGFRRIACETGQFAGKEDPKYDLDSSGSFKTAADLIKEGKNPTTCTMTVYRVIGGVRCPFTHTVVFREFAGTGKWKTMPFQMISKVAEAFALRMGFSDRLTGLSIPEEQAAFEDGQAKPEVYTKEGLKSIAAEVKEKISKITKLEVLRAYYESNEAFRDQEITDLFTERKNQISNGGNN